MGCSASLTTVIRFVLLLFFAIYVELVIGRGPDFLPTLPIWSSSKVDCSLFRNEAVLRPKFRVWPEDVNGVPFEYCCEYQPGAVPSRFDLSNYTYGPNGGMLQPAPYHDLGVVDNDAYMGYNLMHWDVFALPSTKLFMSSSMLYCDMTDLQRLYKYRLFNKALSRGFISFIVVFGLVLLVSFGPKCYNHRQRDRARDRQEIVDETSQYKKTDKDELFSDGSHILLLTLVGCCLMEGISHSPIGGWRSQLLFKVAVTYSYLTVFAFFSVLIRHMLTAHDPQSGHKDDWRWQKVFGQLAALLILSAYLVLVEDVTGCSLDAVSGLVLGTCVAASIWSGGVELVIICRYAWKIMLKPALKCFHVLVNYLMTRIRTPLNSSEDQSSRESLMRTESPSQDLQVSGSPSAAPATPQPPPQPPQPPANPHPPSAPQRDQQGPSIQEVQMGNLI